MANLKTGNLSKELDELERYFFENDSYIIDEIMEWSTKCIIMFELLNIEKGYINKFANRVNPQFKLNDGFGLYIGLDQVNPNLLQIIERLPDREYDIRLVFNMARKKLEIFEEEQKLVPKFIFNNLPASQEFEVIKALLQSVEKSYTKKNPNELLSSSRTLMDEIFNLDSSLAGKDLSNKIRFLNTNQQLSKKFGINKEFLFGLDNSRLIRNTKLQHPKKIVSHEITFAIAVSCAFLVVTLLEFTIAAGELIDAK